MNETEKIIQIQYADDGRLFALTDQGNIYVKMCRPDEKDEWKYIG